MAHTCVTLNTTGFRCWGYNSNGQLGNASISLSTYVIGPPTTDTALGFLSGRCVCVCVPSCVSVCVGPHLMLAP